jgi:hypothetical protein
MRLGIEIECEFSKNVLEKIEYNRIGVYDYHSDERANVFKKFFWVVERDASLQTLKYTHAAEFVSRILTAKNFLDAYDEFEKITQNEFYINSSMGLHHHISFTTLQKYDLNTFCALMRTEFFNLIRNSDIKTKDNILKHYYRSYAKEVKDIYAAQTRYVEFNRLTNYRIEWRSVNAVGVDNVADLRKITNFVIKSVNYAIKNYKFDDVNKIYEEEETEEKIKTDEIESKTDTKILLIEDKKEEVVECVL